MSTRMVSGSVVVEDLELTWLSGELSSSITSSGLGASVTRSSISPSTAVVGLLAIGLLVAAGLLDAAGLLAVLGSALSILVCTSLACCCCLAGGWVCAGAGWVSFAGFTLPGNTWAAACLHFSMFFSVAAFSSAAVDPYGEVVTGGLGTLSEVAPGL